MDLEFLVTTTDINATFTGLEGIDLLSTKWSFVKQSKLVKTVETQTLNTTTRPFQDSDTQLLRNNRNLNSGFK